MKRIILFLLAFISPLFGQEEKPLVVGTTSGYAPYVSLNQEGAYEGFDIDVANLLAEKLGRRVVIQDCGSMPGLMLALKQKKVDLLLWSISITEDRQKSMEMIYYQGEKVTKMPFLFWKKVPVSLNSIEDLGNLEQPICTEAGTFQEAVLQKFPQVRYKNVDKITEVILELKYGKSTAAPVDPSLVSRFTSQYPELKVVWLPLLPSQQSLGNGICVSKENQALASQVRSAVAALLEEGKIQEREKKWGLAAEGRQP